MAEEKALRVSRAEVFAAGQAIEWFSDKSAPPKLAYQLVKLKRALEPEVAAIREAQEQLAKILSDYEEKRVSLAADFAEKDDSGNPIIEDNRYKIPPERMDEFSQALNKLRNEFSSDFERFEKESLEFNKFLSEDVEITFRPVSLDLLEKGFPNVSMSVIEALSPFLE